MGLLLVPFPTGWEVGIAVAGLKTSQLPDGIIVGNCRVYNANTGEGPAGFIPPECNAGGNSWRIDIDNRNYGSPSLTITTQQPRHTDAGGEPTPHDQAADSRTVTRQRDTWYLDRHIFMFEFQVNTVADSVVKNCFYVEGCSFDHETSAFVPNFTSDILRGTVEVSNNGLPFDGSSLILFSINPWQGVRIVPENTVLFDQWVGIMQATIFKVENGKVPGAPGSQDFSWAAEKLLSEGGQPNMFSLEGSELTQTEVLPSGPDNRIPRQVIIELPYKLIAGAAMKKNFFGSYNGLAPINVYAKYIVRVDVLVATGFTPQLDYVDANNNRIRDPGEFTFIDKNNDNLWTAGVDEAVEGTPPAPPPPPPAGVDCTSGYAKGADGNCYKISLEIPPPPPTGLQTGCPPNCPTTIQPPPDIFFPSCNFLDFECRLSNWLKFPSDPNLLFSLLLPVIVLVVIVLIAITFFGVAIGRRRGR